jgi:hypothetical protein
MPANANTVGLVFSFQKQPRIFGTEIFPDEGPGHKVEISGPVVSTYTECSAIGQDPDRPSSALVVAAKTTRGKRSSRDFWKPW